MSMLVYEGEGGHGLVYVDIVYIIDIETSKTVLLKDDKMTFGSQNC